MSTLNEVSLVKPMIAFGGRIVRTTPFSVTFYPCSCNTCNGLVYRIWRVCYSGRMATGKLGFNNRQLLFKEFFVGTLIYAVTLGFFNDYTSVVYARSFSWVFYASLVLQLLTMLAFWLKNQIIRWLRGRKGAAYTFLMFFCAWLVMFVSKFVFVWGIDLIFSDNIDINGFFGILAVVACVTIVHKFADWAFVKLGQSTPENPIAYLL